MRISRIVRSVSGQASKTIIWLLQAQSDECYNIVICKYFHIPICFYICKKSDMDCEVLYRNSRRLIMHQRLEFKRELYSKINWNARFIGIKGPKGVGKSTMRLQYIKENLKNENVLYVSLDDMWYSTNSIMDLVEYHYVNGGTHLFVSIRRSTYFSLYKWGLTLSH